MEIHKYNRLKAASKRVQSEISFDSAEWEQARPQVKIVLAGTWLSEQMGHNISTVSRWMTNRSALWDASKERRFSQPSVEQLYEIERHLDVDVKELLVSSK